MEFFISCDFLEKKEKKEIIISKDFLKPKTATTQNNGNIITVNKVFQWIKFAIRNDSSFKNNKNKNKDGKRF